MATRDAVFRTLISTDVLAERVGDAGWVIIDCRFDLLRPEWGEEAYAQGHVPGAVYAHLERDLSGRKTGRNGRHPLPDPRQLAGTLGRWGIDRTVQIVAYDQDNGMFASRLWWLLRLMGHDRVAVLDGGLRRWMIEHRPVRAGVETRTPRDFPAQPAAGAIADARAVAQRLGAGDWRILDARAPERFRGDVEPLDPVAGHIPGARNHPFGKSLTPARTFLPVEVLRRDFESSLGGVAPERTIVYCGSGVTACHALLALEHAGLSGARLYPGSWSEWCSDPARPIERGD